MQTGPNFLVSFAQEPEYSRIGRNLIHRGAPQFREKICIFDLNLNIPPLSNVYLLIVDCVMIVCVCSLHIAYTENSVRYLLNIIPSLKAVGRSLQAA